MGLNQALDALAQLIRPRTRLAEKGLALADGDLERGQEEFTQLAGCCGHAGLLHGPSTSNAEMEGKVSGKKGPSIARLGRRALEFAVEPRTRERPAFVGGRAGQPQHLAGLVDGEAG